MENIRMANEPIVTGLFRDRESAERAYQSASSRGYTTDDINLAMSEETRKRHFGGTSGTTTGAFWPGAAGPWKCPAVAGPLRPL